mgnify:CR=1 FL=1
MATALIKKKAGIGSSPDLPYDQAFANIAHEHLQSRVPTLLEFEIGFQLIDKSKDGDKALGAFGFKVNERDVLIPVIYQNGEVKGHEVLYVPDQDVCLPSTEPWVNYLTQKQPDSLGEGVRGNRSALGIRGPLLQLITRSPLKLASDNSAAKEVLSRFAEWSHPLILMMAKLAKMNDKQRMEACPSTAEMLKSCSWQAQAKFLHLLDEFPGFKLALEKVEPALGIQLAEVVENTAKALEEAAKPLIQRVEGSKQNAPMEIISYTAAAKTLVPYSLSDAEQKKLVDKGYVIRDRRLNDQKSKLHINIEERETLGLTNPSGNFISGVVMRPFTIKGALVIADPVGIKEKDRTVYVVTVEDKKLFRGDKNSVFVEDEMEDMEVMESFYSKLPLVRDFKFKTGWNNTYIILKRAATGFDATNPISIERDLGKQGDHRLVALRGECGYFHGPNKTTAIDLKDGMRYPAKYKQYSKFDRGDGQLRIAGEGRIRMGIGEINIPEDARVLEVKERDFDDKEELGGLRDASNVLWRHLIRIDVTRGFNKGREYNLNTLKGLSKSGAVLTLVKQLSLAEEEAEQFLDSLQPGQTKTAGIEKAAQPSWFNDNGNAAAPEFPWDTNTGDNVNANPNFDNDSPIRYNVPVEGLMSSQNDPSVWDPRNEPDPLPGMEGAMAAAQRGQRDVMSTKAILSIANKSQSNSLGPIIKAIDSLGRRYIAFCWQRESMNEQYGTSDANDIEDSLLENLESLGELAISMYERNVKAGDSTELLKAKLTVHAEDVDGEE